jgi:hypothetical protein
MDIWDDDNPDDNDISDEYRFDEDISDNDNTNDHDQEFKTTFEQEKGAIGSKDVAKSCGNPIPFNIKPGTKEYSQAIANKTPLERFKLDVDYVSKLLSREYNDFILSVSDRDTMCEKADETLSIGIDPKYLNALGYVMGYIVNKKNGLIKIGDKNEKEKIKIINNIIGTQKNNFNKLELINQVASKARSGNSFAVYPADVIRYSQLWGRLL